MPKFFAEAGPSLGFVENLYSAVKAAVFIAYGGRIVSASVIYKNQLIIAQRLGNHAFNAFAQVLFCIEDWNNYRNFHTLFHGAGGYQFRQGGDCLKSQTSHREDPESASGLV